MRRFGSGRSRKLREVVHKTEMRNLIKKKSRVIKFVSYSDHKYPCIRVSNGERGNKTRAIKIGCGMYHVGVFSNFVAETKTTFFFAEAATGTERAIRDDEK